MNEFLSFKLNMTLTFKLAWWCAPELMQRGKVQHFMTYSIQYFVFQMVTLFDSAIKECGLVHVKLR